MRNEELRNLHSFSACHYGGQLRGMRWLSSCRVLVGKSEGKRLLGEPGCRWEDNSEIEVKEIGPEDVE